MLKLDRRPGERIVIETPAGPVLLTVLRIVNHKGRWEVKLGLEADKSIRIERDDMHRKPIALKTAKD